MDVGFAEGGCVRIVPGQKTWKDYERPDLRSVPNEKRIIMPAVLERSETKEQAVEVVALAMGLSKLKPLRVVQTPISEVAIRYEWLSHLVEKKKDARERYANYILPTLTNPFEIWLTEYEDGPRHRYIGLFQGQNDLMSVIRINKDGNLLWNIMQAKDKKMNKMRIGKLLWAEK
jgi:hypothetical protein